MITVDPEPPLDEVLALAGQAMTLKPVTFALFMHQVVRSEVHGFRDAEGRLLCVVGALLVPHAWAVELWMVSRPDVARHLPGLVRRARLTVARLLQDRFVVKATVREGHRPGARLCALLGLSHVATTGGFEAWEVRP